MLGKIALLHFLAEDLFCFEKRNPSKCKFPDFRLFTWKLTKFLMLVFTPRVNFLVHCFHHCSVSWKIAPLYFYSLNIVYFGQKNPINKKSKGAHQVPNFRLSISPNLYFYRHFLLKLYKISAKKYRSYVSWYWRMIKSLRKSQCFVSKTTKIWWIWIWPLKRLKKYKHWLVPFVQSI